MSSSRPSETHDLKPSHSTLKVLLITLASLVGLVLVLLYWAFGMAHQFATLQLGEHKLVFKVEYELDVSSAVWCELDGPKQRHGHVLTAFIGASQKLPTFTVHQSASQNVYWVTPDPMPNLIVYALDANTGEIWFANTEHKNGEKFLNIANASVGGYKLYQFEWIGSPR